MLCYLQLLNPRPFSICELEHSVPCRISTRLAACVLEHIHSYLDHFKALDDAMANFFAERREEALIHH